MPVTHELKAARRTKPANHVRHTGHVPAIVYGHKLDSQNVEVDSREFLKVYAQAGATTLVNLNVEGTTHNVLIREVQLHPVRDHVLHVDFYQVRMDEAITADVPLKFVGEASAVKDLGGIFVRNTDTVEVKALPKDLPYDIEVDISSLTEFDKAIHIADLTLPEGVTILNKPTQVVALIQAPRSEEELKSLEEEVKVDVEAVEATAEKKPEEEGAAPAEGETLAAPAEEKK